MSNKKNEDHLITRRQMLGYCLASVVGLALWRLRRYSDFMPAGSDESTLDGLKGNEADTDNLTEQFTSELIKQGADLVGIGDLTEIAENDRNKLPVGICLAVKFPKDVVSGIVDLPTREYYDAYNTLNSRLYSLTDKVCSQCPLYFSKYRALYSRGEYPVFSRKHFPKWLI